MITHSPKNFPPEEDFAGDLTDDLFLAAEAALESEFDAPFFDLGPSQFDNRFFNETVENGGFGIATALGQHPDQLLSWPEQTQVNPQDNNHEQISPDQDDKEEEKEDNGSEYYLDWDECLISDNFDFPFSNHESPDIIPASSLSSVSSTTPQDELPPTFHHQSTVITEIEERFPTPSDIDVLWALDTAALDNSSQELPNPADHHNQELDISSTPLKEIPDVEIEAPVPTPIPTSTPTPPSAPIPTQTPGKFITRQLPSPPHSGQKKRLHRAISTSTSTEPSKRPKPTHQPSPPPPPPHQPQHKQQPQIPALRRPPHPTPLPPHSLVSGLTPSSYLKTCFRITDALHLADSGGLGFPSELKFTARISFISLPSPQKRTFQFLDLCHDHPPYLSGYSTVFRAHPLWTADAEKVVVGSVVRVVGRMRRSGGNMVGGTPFVLEVKGVEVYEWEDVGEVFGEVTGRGVVSVGG
ncbi:hypothetical protein EX30DRAFT_365090 [Ascodesmis nigricans]|uniref:Uncharacterized protein n=1 Tax=Ascodesmis nigricans TaxID=341454 RepID=A0A4S2MQN3_9PEZI|nr:hypothetical protein EX30DRAFT_365090 [Ascodesmis nigricans]